MLYEVITAPGLLAAFVSPGLDVFIGQSFIGVIGLFILWRRWREAKRLQSEQQQLLLKTVMSRELSFPALPLEGSN